MIGAWLAANADRLVYAVVATGVLVLGLVTVRAMARDE